jgi:hypothetical protein
MTQLQRTSESFAGTDQRWLGSREGTDTARTVTLDHDAWESKVVNGRLLGGDAMALNSGTGKYEPATTGVEGFLLNDIPFRVDPVGKPDCVAPMLDRGRIVLKYLPTAVAAGELPARFTAIEVA